VLKDGQCHPFIFKKAEEKETINENKSLVLNKRLWMKNG